MHLKISWYQVVVLKGSPLSVSSIVPCSINNILSFVKQVWNNTEPQYQSWLCLLLPPSSAISMSVSVILGGSWSEQRVSRLLSSSSLTALSLLDPLYVTIGYLLLFDRPPSIVLSMRCAVAFPVWGCSRQCKQGLMSLASGWWKQTEQIYPWKKLLIPSCSARQYTWWLFSLPLLSVFSLDKAALGVLNLESSATFERQLTRIASWTRPSQ